ncbi:MAG: hypothetical protein NTW68_04450 [candidate division NC10 bacterium]|nr:hypothetical protein [candidate division NC10 bacterium]
MLPHVVLHVEASLDGRIDHIRPDVGRFFLIWLTYPFPVHTALRSIA